MSEILQVKDLTIHYKTRDGTAKALNHVSLALKEGSALGLVGETGAGKTTLAKGITRLTPMPPGVIESGEIIYKDSDLLQLGPEEMRQVRGKEISMIFQDPMTSLNPVMTVGEQIAEAVSAHDSKMTNDTAMKQAVEMLEMVGIPGDRANEYPHQFSGGMKQRVVIAIALACNPRILVADEPTTALDVTIQAQVLEMITEIRTRLNTTMLLITHDLGVVAQNCEEVAVIYAGEIVESGEVLTVFGQMCHPYTIGLFNSVPSLEKDVDRLIPIDGLMPDPMNLPEGCHFSTRCEHAQELCRQEHPGMTDLGGGHMVRCHFPQGKKEATDEREA